MAKILIKLLAHTRDIEEGKGEYALTFAILKKMMTRNEKLCIDLMKIFVDEKNDKPMGSLKDMKYFFNTIKNVPEPLIKVINDQLKNDLIGDGLKNSCFVCVLACFNKVVMIFAVFTWKFFYIFM